LGIGAAPGIGETVAAGITGATKGGKTTADADAGEPMLGANGPRFDSKTIWKGEGKERIDVENPNPGQRPGQIHYQDNQGNKYLYDPNSNTFLDAPNSVNRLLDDPKFSAAVEKGMTKYLGGK
jgi:filamentous hemagglutinin